LEYKTRLEQNHHPDIVELLLGDDEVEKSTSDWYKEHNLSLYDIKSWSRLTKLCLLFAKVELEGNRNVDESQHTFLKINLLKFNLDVNNKPEMYKMIEEHRSMLMLFKKVGKVPNKILGISNKFDCTKTFYGTQNSVGI
jgi:hypothetical protein